MHGAHPAGHNRRCADSRPPPFATPGVVVAAARCAVEALEDRLLFATFSVTNTLDTGAGSLRAAITSANGAAGADTIAFAIPGTGTHTIRPATPLPAVAGPTTIDAGPKNADGSVQVEIDGSGITASTGAGLQITGGGTTVRNLAIH